MRAVLAHDHAPAEPLACLVVEVVAAEALAEREPMVLLLELDLDAPLVSAPRIGIIRPATTTLTGP